MTVTFPLTPPADPNPESMIIRPRQRVARPRSPFSGVTQTQEWQAGWWEMEITLPVLHGDEVRAWTAFLTALRGPRGSFLYGDPLRTSPDGAGGGAPVVAGGSQSGITLDTDGWPVSTTVLLAGDHIQLGSGATAYLHMVTQDAVTDGGGAVTLDIWPRLRTPPADNAPITVNSPRGRWRLADAANEWRYQPARQARLAIRAVEDL